MRFDHIASRVVNVNHGIVRPAVMLRVTDCVGDTLSIAIPQPPEWQRIGDEIKAAMIFARTDFLAAALFPFRLLPAQSLVFVDGKMVFQSSFMLITIQPFFFASAISASLKVPIFDSEP